MALLYTLLLKLKTPESSWPLSFGHAPRPVHWQTLSALPSDYILNPTTSSSSTITNLFQTSIVSCPVHRERLWVLILTLACLCSVLQAAARRPSKTRRSCRSPIQTPTHLVMWPGSTPSPSWLHRGDRFTNYIDEITSPHPDGCPGLPQLVC